MIHPYEQGEEAFKKGLPITANPYAWGSEDQASWARGWRADGEAKRKKREREAAEREAAGEDDDIPF